jgi:hypothetical protein
MTLLQRLARQPLDHFLAALAGAVALLTCLYLWWLLLFGGVRADAIADLYVLEMLLLSLSGAAAVWLPDLVASWAWVRWPWMAAGALAGFAVMGLWSIGPTFAPISLLLFAAAPLADRRLGRSTAAGLGLFLAAAVAQAAGMLALIRIR